MYNKLLDLIEEESNVDVVKHLNIIKHKIDRGEPEDVSIREVYEYLSEEQTASLDENYIKNVQLTVEALNKLLNEDEKEEVVVEEAVVSEVEDLKQEVNEEENYEDDNKPVEAKVEKHDDEEEDEDEEDEEDDKEREVNKMSGALKVLAFLEGGLGLIAGLFVLENSFAYTISYWVLAAVSVLFTLSLAEAIQILHDIRKNGQNK
jgi:cation transport ATPase